MSLYLCLAMPPGAEERVAACFDKRIWHSDASNDPIGIATIGKNRFWKAVYLGGPGSLVDVVGIGSRKTENSDCAGVFVSGIEALSQDRGCSSLSFIVHWFSGFISVEQILIRREQAFELSGLAEVILNVEEDVRYTVFV